MKHYKNRKTELKNYKKTQKKERKWNFGKVWESSYRTLPEFA